MIGANLVRVGLVVALAIASAILCQPSHAAMLMIDREQKDSTRTEDTLPFIPADEGQAPLAPTDEGTLDGNEPSVEPLSIKPVTTAEPPMIGDVTFGLGYSAPQGTFTRYADVGFHASLRVNFRSREQVPVSLWFGLAYTHFSRQESRVYVELPDLAAPYFGEAREVLEEDAYAIQVGLQLGNPTRRGFFRPRASFGVGLYIFSTTVSYLTYGWPEAEELWGYTDQLLGRFGWRGVIGADLFFTPRWGLAVDFHYDHVFRLNLSEAATIRNVTARFQGVAVGVTFATEHLDLDN